MPRKRASSNEVRVLIEITTLTIKGSGVSTGRCKCKVVAKLARENVERF